jgi:hypothetical protein
LGDLLLKAEITNCINMEIIIIIINVVHRLENTEPEPGFKIQSLSLEPVLKT